MRAVASGAARVHGAALDGDPQRVLQHCADESVDLLGRLPLGAQRHREAGDLRGGRLTRHHLVHSPGRVVGGERLTSQERGEQDGPGPLGHSVGPE